MAIAEHNPEKLHKENRGVLSMSKSQLHDYASTKGLTGKKSAADRAKSLMQKRKKK